MRTFIDIATGFILGYVVGMAIYIALDLERDNSVDDGRVFVVFAKTEQKQQPETKAEGMTA